MWIQVNFIHLVAVALLLPSFAIAQTDNIDLAKKYVDLRAATFRFQPPAQTQFDDSTKAAVVTQIVDELIGKDVRTKNWATEHPARQELRQMVLEDLKAASERINKEIGNPNLLTQLENAFARGIATSMTKEQLEELITYYSSPLGQSFAATQGLLYANFERDVAKLQTQMQQIKKPTLPPPENDLADLLNLFDEVVRIQWAWYDPGAAGDRSGLQAIGMITSVVVVQNFIALDSVWKEISSENRMAVTSRRRSEIGLSEREAVYKAASNLRAIFDPNEGAKKLMASMIELEAKWRDLHHQLAKKYP
jgi:hypothetical protein